MAIKHIEKISCSLNLGLIYSLDYSFSPKDGVKITAYFVNESGVYQQDFLNANTPCSISVGDARFNVYPISFEIITNAKQRILKVEFWDNTFKLDNYHIVLKGRGCGANVFQIGSATEFINGVYVEKVSTQNSLTFDDITYTFSDFINVLRSVFPVNIVREAQFASNIDIRGAHTGTFRSVLSAWCNDLGLSFFFENNSLVIVDPTSFNVSFPTPPTDALSISESKSLEGTYSKTGCLYAQIEGGEINIGEIYNKNILDAARLKTTLSFRPLFNDTLEFNFGQELPDIKQVIAAMHGKEFWFLYNFYNNIAKKRVTIDGADAWLYDEIGFYLIEQDSIPLNSETVTALYKAAPNRLIASFIDEGTFSSNYEKYKQYGERICGRYYLTDRLSDIDYYENFKFIRPNQLNEEKTVSFTDVQEIKFDRIISPIDGERVVIDGTQIGENFSITTYGDRLLYIDDIEKDYEQMFAISDDEAETLIRVFDTIIKGIPSSNNFRFNGNINWVLSSIPITQPLFLNGYVGSRMAALNPRFKNGISFNGVSKDSNLSGFYPKFEKCVSSSSFGNALNHRASIKQIVDTSMDKTKNLKGSVVNGKIIAQRDLSNINAQFSSGVLQILKKPKLIPYKSLSFTTNYFYDFGANPLSNGLTSASVSIGDNGVSATYVFSNEILFVETEAGEVARLESMIRNSYIQKYIEKPTRSII